jgi:hypothetical protein
MGFLGSAIGGIARGIGGIFGGGGGGGGLDLSGLLGTGGGLLGAILAGGGDDQERLLSTLIPYIQQALQAQFSTGQTAGAEADLFKDLSLPGFEKAQGEFDKAQGVYDTSLGTLNEGLGEFRGALGDLSPAAQYYRGILSTTAGADEVLGPEREAISQNYNNILNTLDRGARGGGGLAATADFEFRKAKDFMDLIPRARQMAAEGIVNTAGARMQGASGIAGVGGQQAGVGANVSATAGQRGSLSTNLAQIGQGYRGISSGAFGSVMGQSGVGANLANTRSAAGSSFGEQIGGFLGGTIGDVLERSGTRTATRPRTVATRG